MKIISSILFSALIASTSNVAMANTVTIDFTGFVENFMDFRNILNGSLQATSNDPVTGEMVPGEYVSGVLSFVDGKIDGNPSLSEGDYSYSNGEIRIQLDTSIGVFDTGSNSPGGLIHTTNDDIQNGDYISISSSVEGGPQPENQYLSNMSFWMQDMPSGTHDAIDSDALPGMLVPSDWDLIYLSVSGNNTDYQMYDFKVTITSASVSAIPLPASVWLFCSGVIGLLGVSKRRI